MKNKKLTKKNIYYIVLGCAIIVCIIFFTLFKKTSPSPVNESNASSTTSVASSTSTDPIQMFKYIEIISGCGSNFVGGCVNLRSGPGTNYPVINKLRIGVVLKVSETVIKDDQTWYKIKVDDTIYFPDRVAGDWYVSTVGVRLFEDPGVQNYKLGDVSTSSKKIVVDVSEQSLTAYDGDTIFMQVPVSTGLKLTPTNIGKFRIFKKTPSRYMQGPIPGSANVQPFDLPGVPWDLYFTKDGQVIHGAYWHVGFGHRWSHGCVNLAPENAKKLYSWAEVGTLVVVQE